MEQILADLGIDGDTSELVRQLGALQPDFADALEALLEEDDSFTNEEPRGTEML